MMRLEVLLALLIAWPLLRISGEGTERECTSRPSLSRRSFPWSGFRPLRRSTLDRPASLSGGPAFARRTPCPVISAAAVRGGLGPEVFQQLPLDGDRGLIVESVQ